MRTIPTLMTALGVMFVMGLGLVAKPVRAEASKLAAFMVWALNFVQKDHCKIAYEKMIGLEERDTGVVS